MYIVDCPEMWTEEKKFDCGESLTDVCKYLETCRISESQVVNIVHIDDSDLRETWETAKDKDKYRKIKISLIPKCNGAIVDL